MWDRNVGNFMQRARIALGRRRREMSFAECFGHIRGEVNPSEPEVNPKGVRVHSYNLLYDRHLPTKVNP